jgi:hypothetical protein
LFRKTVEIVETSGCSNNLLLYFFEGISRTLFMMASAGRPARRKAAVSIFTADLAAVRGEAAALVGWGASFPGEVFGEGVGVVWAEAGPQRATSVRPSRKKGLGFITGEKGKAGRY